MNAMEYAQTGEALMNESRWEQAITNFNRAVELDSTLGWAYYGLGFCKMKCRTDEEALLDLAEACKLMPNFAEAFFQRGFVLSALERHDEAISAFSQTIKIDPSFSKAYLYRGINLLNSKGNMQKKAEEDFLTASRLGNQDAEQWIVIARSLGADATTTSKK